METQENKVSAAEVGEMVRRLMAIMEREIEGANPSAEDSGPDSIARLELDSLALIGFLVAVEDEFKIEWDSDADLDVLRSFEAMAQYILGKGVSAS